MGKLVSIVTTCLVVSSSRLVLIKTDWVDGSHDGPSWSQMTFEFLVLKHLNFEIWYGESTL